MQALWSCHKFGVDSSSGFSFKVQTHTHRHTVRCAANHPYPRPLCQRR